MINVEKQNTADHTTFGLSKEVSFVLASSAQDIEKYITYAKTNALPFYILGGGSNTIATDSVSTTLVIKNEVMGIKETYQEEGKVHIHVGAGEDWDALVLYCIDRGYSGIEALAKIPGTVGAAPVQNIGAYGTELDEIFVEAEVLDARDMTCRIFKKEDCEFGYRTSVFKRNPGKYVITKVVLELNLLSEDVPLKFPDYPSVKEYCKENNLQPTLENIYNVLSEIRASKLPDTKVLPNSGSFFANPIISEKDFEKLHVRFPRIPNFPIKDQDRKLGQDIKIPAGWLIEQAGFKGKEIGNIKVHESNALVLTNPERKATHEDLQNAISQIRNKVKEKFDIVLEQEPVELE